MNTNEWQEYLPENYITEYEKQKWFQRLNEAEQTLVATSLKLLKLFESDEMQANFIDFSFTIFPIAKCYEGFLKSYLLQKNLINHDTFSSKKWRIGRALNPDISQSQRDELWFFDDIAEYLGTEKSREIWDTWLECRNHVFHYFPDSGLNLYATYEQAKRKIEQVIQAIVMLVEDLNSEAN